MPHRRPVHTPGFQTLPYFTTGCRAPDSSARLILDLSQSSGDSVNDNIDKQEFPCNFDAATDLAFRMGKRCYLTKIDIKHAYRLFPVRREDWPLLAYYWQGFYYVGIKLPFSGRSSASLFTSFAELVCCVLNEKWDLLVIHYSDDFLIQQGRPHAPLSTP